MERRRKAAILPAIVVALAGISALIVMTRVLKRQPITLRGAVIRQDVDINKEVPVAGVQITALNGSSRQYCRSDSSGFFTITLARGIKRGQGIILEFRQPEYQPLNLNEVAGEGLYVVHLMPIPQPNHVDSNRPQAVVSNVRVRYTVKVTTAINVGSAVKTFQVVNKGNVPCRKRAPCSPDGKWKAAVESVSLDAGHGSEFRNARVSCIAGPCPFTRIEVDGFSRGGRSISLSVRNWSDTATFLLEAEVFHPMVSDSVRLSYPVIFGRALNFTLPAEAEGVSIEADVDRAPIVFPLGPGLSLSWADCDARVTQNQTRVYRCELKPSYHFS